MLNSFNYLRGRKKSALKVGKSGKFVELSLVSVRGCLKSTIGGDWMRHPKA